MRFSAPLLICLLTLTASAAEEGAWEANAIWKAENPKFTEKGSREFQTDGPMLRSVRVSKREIPSGETCASMFGRLRDRPIGALYVSGLPERFAGWEDWKDDLDAIEGCSGFPCKIKFNEPESLAVAAKAKPDRLAEVVRQIDGRIAEYSKTFRRKGYDLPEDAVDPWKTFVAHGHDLPVALEKSKPTYFARKLKFGEAGSYRPIRQIFDERTLVTKDRFVRISRDVYTAHYFDGWGEWLEARCSKDGKTLFVLQDLLMEFDLLKNTDFFSRIARPKMRQGVDQESLRLQKEQIAKIFDRPASK